MPVTHEGSCRCGAACGRALWGWHPDYPEQLHPFASAINSDLPQSLERTHIMTGAKAARVQPAIRPSNQTLDEYSDQSIEGWHRSRNL